MQTPTEEPKQIATEIEQVFSRMQERACVASELPRPSTSAHAINLELASRGFPERHRQNLGSMAGPSLDKARSLLPRLIAGDCLLLLLGDRGPGKTQMATWWAHERMRAGKFAGWYRKTADLIGEIKRTWRDGGKSVGTEDDILRKYRKAEYLVLDEFHERGSSEWESRTLNNIIDHRYDNMLATVIIANMNEAQVRAEINPSIISRAEETGGLVVCDWPSYRTK